MGLLIGGAIPPLRRDLEMAPISHNGKPMMLLSDAAGLQQESVAVSPSAVMVAALFDGLKRAEEIHADLVKEQVPLSLADVQAVADEMEKHGLLETAEIQERRRRLWEEFQRSPVRTFPGKSRGLPEDALGLAAFLGGFYKDPKGPGEVPDEKPVREPPVGVISPHIDFFRGGPAYAWAYGELAKRRPPDVVVAVGVAHLSPKSPWVMTRKAYQTPFGPLEVDESLYREMRDALWYDPLEEEWVHAKEHSLEFQALWLKYLWRDKTPKWVPLMCSSYERFCSDRAPSSVATVEGALRAIGEKLFQRAQKGQRISVLAGIDLAHVGRRFGDDMEVTPELQKKVEESDRLSLEKALALDADAFFLSGVGEGAWRKVCGLSALYTALRWIRALSDGKALDARLLAYDQAPDPTGGIVSFAGAVFDFRR